MKIFRGEAITSNDTKKRVRDTFNTNGEVGKNRRQLNAEIRGLSGEMRSRQFRQLDTDDQAARGHNLRDARNQLN